MTLTTLSYAREKSAEAVRVLATHPGEIKERSDSALVPHIASIGSLEKRRDIPDDLYDEYREFWNSVTSGTPIAGEGTLQASVREMSTEEAVETAKLIYRLAYEFRVLRRAATNVKSGKPRRSMGMGEIW